MGRVSSCISFRIINWEVTPDSPAGLHFHWDLLHLMDYTVFPMDENLAKLKDASRRYMPDSCSPPTNGNKY